MDLNRERSRIVLNFIKIITIRLFKLILKSILNKVNKFLINDIKISYL